MASRKKTKNSGAVARRLQSHLDAALSDARELAQDLGPGLGETVEENVAKPISDAARVSASLAALLATLQGGAAPAKRGPQTKPKAGPARKGGGGKRGRRGVRANLSPEEIRSALEKSGGVKSKAAAALGVNIATFNKYLAALDAPAATPKAAKKAARKKRATKK